MLNIKYPALYCPFPSAINPHYEAAYQHTLEWVRSFNIVTDESVYQRWRAINFSGWAARVYPHAPLEVLEICSDFTVWSFLADDELEEAGISKRPESLPLVQARYLDILKGAELTDSDTLLARALRDIRQRLLQHARSEWMLCFTAHIEDFFKGVLWEALNHSQGIRPDVATYIQIRELTIGSGLFFSLLHLTARLALPSEVMEHPMVKRLNLVANHIVGWMNDICSAEKEIREGSVHNLVVALQHQYQIPLQEAFERAAELHDAQVRTFIELSAHLPSFGAEIDANLQRYLSGLRFMMRGSLDWCLQSGRYWHTETMPSAA